MIFHIPGLAHTRTDLSFLSCAFTQKVRKLSKMLTEAGHTVYHYGCEGSDVVCTDHIDLCTDADRIAAHPHNDDRTRQYQFDGSSEFTRNWNARCASEIARRRQAEGEFLLCAWGHGHKPIADALGASVIAVESGIGYIGTFARFRVFESAFHMAWTWGREGREDGDWWSAVIPNFFEPSEFEYRAEKSDYLLYLGRLARRKGVELAADIAQVTGHRLVIAGQGLLSDEGMTLAGRGHIDFVGYADLEKRRELLAGARALVCPTYYIEPFGGVAVEAQLSGTPVICTDWGGFRENVNDGVTGYRCSTFAEFCRAVERLPDIDPEECLLWALSRFSCDAVTPLYEQYFERILRQGAVLEGANWYSR